MQFVWPGLLWSLWALPLAWVIYLWLLRREKASALVYPSLTLIRPALGRLPTWRRHAPPLLLWLALAATLLGLARPLARVTLPSDHTTLVLAMDVSRSMLAQDVPPSRIEASQAAVKAFLKDLPTQVRVGLVTFAASAQLAQNITDSKEDLTAAIDRFQLQRGTATGSGLMLALATLLPDAGLTLEDAVYGAGFGPRGPAGTAQGGARSLDEAPAAPKASPQPVPVGSYTGGAIILLSDGRRTAGPDPMDVAKKAADLGVRVHTVAFGTPDGFIPGTEGLSYYTRVDEETLQAVAKATGGEFFRAANAQDLQQVYQKLSSRIHLETRMTEVSVLLALAGLMFTLAGLTLSLVWWRRPA